MNRQLCSPNAGSTIVGVLQPYEGGTGQTTGAAALAALGGVPATQLGQPSGVAQLGTDGNLNPDNIPVDGVTMVALSGPTSMGINSVATFEITNYDAFTSYALVALAGTVTRYKSTITYSSSSSAGPAGFRINGRLMAVNVVGNRPSTPTAFVTAYGAAKDVTATFSSSAFAMSSGAGTHASSDWQVATDAKFDNVVKSTTFDSVNLTSWSTNGLKVSTTYFGRVRYRDNNGNYSEWSSVATFTSLPNYAIGVEERKIANPAAAASSGFNRCRLSADGSRLAVGNSGEDTNTGYLYIYVRTGLTWALEQRIRPADSLSGDFFGYFFEFSDDGSRIMATATNDTEGGVNVCGSAYIYLRTGNVWTLEQKITATDKSAGAQLGNRGVMDGSGSRIAVSSYSTHGSFYVFLRTGTVWAQEQKIDCPVAYAGSKTNFDWLEISQDGQRIVASHGDDVIGGVACGSVYVYLRTGTTWALEATLSPVAKLASANFGYRAVLSKDGSVCAVAAPGEPLGRVYVFTRNGTVWNQTASFVAADTISGDTFASMVCISGDGKRIVANAFLATYAGLTTAGSVYVFANNGAIWSQESRIGASDASAGLQFGAFSDLSGDGTRLVVSGPTAGNGPAGQSAYIYR